MFREFVGAALAHRTGVPREPAVVGQ